MLDAFVDWYFRPRSIETQGDARLYRALGVRVYKYYLPTSGDLVSRLRGVRRLDPRADGVAGAFPIMVQRYNRARLLGALQRARQSRRQKALLRPPAERVRGGVA